MITTLRVRKETNMMTKREFLNAVIANVDVVEIADFAKAEIEKTPTVASAVAGELEISTQKASALCRQLVADGELNVTEVKVKGKGKQKGYSVV